MSSREAWAKQIRESVVGRYSYLRGHARFELASLPASVDVDAFIRRLTNKDADRKLLFYLHLLLRPAFQHFVSVDLPELLKAASHRSNVEKEERRGGIRGQVDWPTTLRLRMSARPDPSFFVSRVANRTSDTPENRLIKHFLLLTEEVSDVALNRLSSGAIYQSVVDTKESCRTLQKHPYVRDLRTGPIASQLMKVRATRHRDRRYSELLRFVEEIESVSRFWSWSSALELIAEGYLSPVSDDDLFELFVLIKCLDALKEAYGEAEFIGPIVEGRGAIAVYRNPTNSDESVCLYFDQGPSTFGFKGSEYPRIARAYNLGGSERRPDISIVHAKGALKRLLLIEMKKSDDHDYGRASVYKAMAYLRDFAGLWAYSPGSKPKVALVFPHLDAASASFVESEEDLVLVSMSTDDRLRSAIGRFLSS